MFKKIAVGLFAYFVSSFTVIAQNGFDPHLWLEDVDGKNALAWVDATNLKTDRSLSSHALYKEIYNETLATLNAKDKLPNITLRGNQVYTLYKDADHPRGIYRRTSIKKFNSGSADWETVLDIDLLSKQEDVKWVFKGMTCLKPQNELCLIRLSPGGGDAHELREFNLKTLRFVENGFKLPTSKMTVTWMDKDHLFVATDFGRGTLTESGYPRVVKTWQRGTALSSAKELMQTDINSVSIYADRYRGTKGSIDLIFERLNYWNQNYYVRIGEKIVQLNLPESSVILDVIEGELVIKLQEDWAFNENNYSRGSVVLVEPRHLLKGISKDQSIPVTVLVKSTPSAIVESVTVNQKSILVTVLEDVKSTIYRFRRGEQDWVKDAIDLPKTGQLSIETNNDVTGDFYARYEDFLTPPTLYAVDNSLNTKIATQQSATFDSSLMKVEQHFAKSLDGTKVPYFVIMPQDTELDGGNPTHIFAYGGFRASLTPSYSGSYEDHNGAYGKAWLERGGVYVIANIRGGGEYGPAWHSAALLENRHKAFEDFEAVAEDLIARKVTSAQHLGIEGRSNGGLLVGATMVRRPELYGAIICGVPLLDMKRYHKLLAGSSWMAEYGDPSTEDWDFISEYSPYQNVSKNQKYPPIFFFTSTRDDRVHPGHARKMAAKMLSQGHKIDYYENTEGGHKGSVTNDQLAKRIALSFTHLWLNLK